MAPFLLIGALFLNRQVVFNYGKWITRMLRTNPLVGIGSILLTIFAFPVIAAFLFGKAYLYRKVDQLRETAEIEREGEYVPYEEVVPDDTLELPPIEIQEPRPRQNEYDQLFEED